MKFKLLARQTSGSVVCFACETLISIESKTCPHCGQRNPGLWGYARSIRRLGTDFGFLQIVTWGCIGLYAAALLMNVDGIGNDGIFNLLSPDPGALEWLGSTGAIPVFYHGRWWTVLSAGWLHGGLLHIAFNLVWIYYLVPSVAQAYGAGRLVTIYTVSAITGGLLTSSVAWFFPFLPEMFQGAGFSVGASGAIFGLLGALVSYGQRTGRRTVQAQALNFAVVIFLLGFLISRTDNWGHLGGFIGGYGLTQTPWFDANRSQRLADLGVALIALLFTAVSILASVITGLY